MGVWEMHNLNEIPLIRGSIKFEGSYHRKFRYDHLKPFPINNTLHEISSPHFAYS